MFLWHRDMEWGQWQCKAALRRDGVVPLAGTAPGQPRGGRFHALTLSEEGRHLLGTLAPSAMADSEHVVLPRDTQRSCDSHICLFSLGFPQRDDMWILGLMNENESLCWFQNLRLKMFMVFRSSQERQKSKLISTENSFLSHSISHNYTQSGASSLVSDEKQILRGPLFWSKSLWGKKTKELQKRQDGRKANITLQKGCPSFVLLVLIEIIKPSTSSSVRVTCQDLINVYVHTSVPLCIRMCVSMCVTVCMCVCTRKQTDKGCRCWEDEGYKRKWEQWAGQGWGIIVDKNPGF